MSKEIANLLYGDVKDYKEYLKGKRKEGQVVTRVAPSPTGFFHIGGLYQALLARKIAKDGVFFLRIEDTDNKREVQGATELIYDTLTKFEIFPDEGYFSDKSVGNFGPYKQSQRVNIYNSFAKYLVEIDGAYPCFCRKDDSEVAEEHKEDSTDKCRNLTFEEIKENLHQGKEWCLRLKSKKASCKIAINDKIKGERELQANDRDIVLIKSNKIPVYAFAHAVDDTLMGTSVVTRGEEWYISTPSHIELFEMLNFEKIPYAHTPVICKIDSVTGNKRKLSKRLDSEANAMWFLTEGYPPYVVKEYLTNLLNSNYEEWKKQNTDKSCDDFEIKLENIGNNNPVFDIVKLNDYAKEYFAKLDAQTLYEKYLEYCKNYDLDFANYLEQSKDYVTNVLNIERQNAKPRKDIYNFVMIKNYYSYMFDYDFKYEEIENVALFKNVCNAYGENFEMAVDKQAWFEHIKVVASSLNFATDNKAYKQNPENYAGNVAKFCEYIRIAITGRKNSPDLFEIIAVLGENEVVARLKAASL